MSGRRDRHVREPAGGRVPVLPPEQRVDAVGEGAQAIVGGILICGGTGADRHGAERLDPLTLEGAASIGIGDPVGRRLDRGDRCPLGRDGVADPQRAICRSLVDLAGLDQIGIADDTLLVEVTGLLDRLDHLDRRPLQLHQPVGLELVAGPLRAGRKLVQDYLVFGNAFVEVRRNRLGDPLRLVHSMARYTRRGVEEGAFWWVPGGKDAVAFPAGSVVQGSAPSFAARRPERSRKRRAFPHCPLLIGGTSRSADAAQDFA